MTRARQRTLIASITTPLGFYVLALLIIESTLAMVLIKGGFGETLRFTGLILMIVVFAGVLIFVGWLTVKNPKALLYGKEEHAQPELSASALRDQIGDIVEKMVKADCLNNQSE